MCPDVCCCVASSGTSGLISKQAVARVFARVFGVDAGALRRAIVDPMKTALPHYLGTGPVHADQIIALLGRDNDVCICVCVCA